MVQGLSLTLFCHVHTYKWHLLAVIGDRPAVRQLSPITIQWTGQINASIRGLGPNGLQLTKCHVSSQHGGGFNMDMFSSSGSAGMQLFVLSNFFHSYSFSSS